jgi:hypothetical protein
LGIQRIPRRIGLGKRRIFSLTTLITFLFSRHGICFNTLWIVYPKANHPDAMLDQLECRSNIDDVADATPVY